MLTSGQRRHTAILRAGARTTGRSFLGSSLTLAAASAPLRCRMHASNGGERSARGSRAAPAILERTRSTAPLHPLQAISTLRRTCRIGVSFLRPLATRYWHQEPASAQGPTSVVMIGGMGLGDGRNRFQT